MASQHHPGGPVRTRRRRQAGQSLVEAAMTLPFLLLLGLGTADIARAFYFREAVSGAARQAARTAVQPAQQSTGNAACAASAASRSDTVPPAGSNITTIASSAAYESSTNGAAAGTVISGATITVTWHCIGSNAVTNSTATSTDPGNSGSDAVEVRISYTMPLVTPLASQAIGTNGVTIVADYVERAQY